MYRITYLRLNIYDVSAPGVEERMINVQYIIIIIIIIMIIVIFIYIIIIILFVSYGGVSVDRR